MITMKCMNCGGEMTVDLKGEMLCPFCGTKQHFSDSDFRDHKEFRLKLLEFLRSSSDAAADAANDSFLWNNCNSVEYISENDKCIKIDYRFLLSDDGVKTYITKSSVVFIFSAYDQRKADKMFSGLELLDYPSAALKDQSRYFPSVKSRMKLQDGSMLVALNKPENIYPLFAFGELKPEHTAWIVSRLENICCVFEFSGLTHGGIDTHSVYLNPRTHEAFLLGNWWRAERTTELSRGKDLKAVRSTAENVLGPYLSEAPKEFRDFIKSKPAKDAYSDFSIWDNVIEKGLGGHHFIKFDMN